MASIAVVIVTYNSASSLEATLNAVAAQLHSGDELVIVDNGSTDNSAEMAIGHAGVTSVIRSETNLGFAAGCNRGARATLAPLIVFLNPDAVPEPGAIEALRRGPDQWSAWMGVVTLSDGRTINSAGGELHYLGFAWAGRHGTPVTDLPEAPWECAFLSGACLAIRREVWHELGGFAEAFFMYHEDVDLSLRLRLKGRRFGVLPDARVRHDYSFVKGPDKWRLLERNRWFTILRTYPRRLLIVALPLLLAVELVLWVIAARGGWLLAKLRAQAQILQALPEILSQRHRIQRDVRIDPRAFADLLGDGLDSSYFGSVGRVFVVRRSLRALGGTIRRGVGTR